jgi:SAM-dependent methyltransferase
MQDQQAEARRYFKRAASDWKALAAGTTQAFNIIKARNEFVVMVAKERQAKRFLDVGCGTGELVHELSPVAQAVGIDYAEEMIQHARRGPGTFSCASVFDFDMAGFDLISANGFIEYVAYAQMLDFFERVAKALPVGGSLVIGSRNRLFNLVSANAFTKHELEVGAVPGLLEEAAFWTEGRGQPKAVTSLQDADTAHAQTGGIEVSTRFQYTPLQLIEVLRDKGLEVEEVYPIHVHVNPAFRANAPARHNAIAEQLQIEARGNNTLLVNASTFMLHAVKR